VATLLPQFLQGLLNKFSDQQQQGRTNRYSSDAASPHDSRCVSGFASQVADTINNLIQSNSTEMKEECPICLEFPKIESSVLTPCAHLFCKECLLSVLVETGTKENTLKGSTSKAVTPSPFNVEGPCPLCNEWVPSTSIIALSRTDNGAATTKYLNEMSRFRKRMDGATPDSVTELDEPGVRRETWETGKCDLFARKTLEAGLSGASSAKVEAVMQELDNIWKLDPCSKILVFSQFLGFLDMMEPILKKNAIVFGRFDGTMSLKKRVATLEKFKEKVQRQSQVASKEGASVHDRRGEVLLISMKAGGLGINLVAASTVFIVDPVRYSLLSFSSLCFRSVCFWPLILLC